MRRREAHTSNLSSRAAAALQNAIKQTAAGARIHISTHTNTHTHARTAKLRTLNILNSQSTRGTAGIEPTSQTRSAPGTQDPRTPSSPAATSSLSTARQRTVPDRTRALSGAPRATRPRSLVAAGCSGDSASPATSPCATIQAPCNAASEAMSSAACVVPLDSAPCATTASDTARITPRPTPSATRGSPNTPNVSSISVGSATIDTGHGTSPLTVTTATPPSTQHPAAAPLPHKCARAPPTFAIPTIAAVRTASGLTSESAMAFSRANSELAPSISTPRMPCAQLGHNAAQMRRTQHAHRQVSEHCWQRDAAELIPLEARDSVSHHRPCIRDGQDVSDNAAYSQAPDRQPRGTRDTTRCRSVGHAATQAPHVAQRATSTGARNRHVRSNRNAQPSPNLQGRLNSSRREGNFKQAGHGTRPWTPLVVNPGPGEQNARADAGAESAEHWVRRAPSDSKQRAQRARDASRIAWRQHTRRVPQCDAHPARDHAAAPDLLHTATALTHDRARAHQQSNLLARGHQSVNDCTGE